MIAYVFTMADGRVFRFEVNPDRVADSNVSRVADPAWTALTYHQCPNCPLAPAEHPHCPAALDVQAIAAKFDHLLSYERARVEVIAPERTYLKDCDVQTGLRALIGLVMATSACPVLAELKGLARFHLPFATVEETTFRTVSLYLLRQHFGQRAGQKVDLALGGLLKYYEQLQDLNQAFSSRLQAASAQDANLNAINSLYFLSAAVALSLEDQLDALRQQLLPANPLPDPSVP